MVSCDPRASPDHQGRSPPANPRSVAETTARAAWLPPPYASTRAGGELRRLRSSHPPQRRPIRRQRPIAAPTAVRDDLTAIVDGTRPNRIAIDRNDSPPASPREISSRSHNDSRNADRTGSGFGTRCNRNTYRRTACRECGTARNNIHGGAPSATSCSMRFLSPHASKPPRQHLPVNRTRSTGPLH